MSNEAEHYVVKGDADDLARQFHEHYERLAPEFGYETRPESAVPWEDVPEHNRWLMAATVRAVLDDAIPVEPIGTHPNGESFVWLRRPADGATGAEKYLAGRLRDPEYLATYLSEVES